MSPEALLDGLQAAELVDKEVCFAFGSSALAALRFHFEIDQLCLLLSTLRDREGFTEVQIQELRRTFHRHKPQSLERLPPAAMHSALRWLGHTFSFDAAQHLIAEVDVDGENTFDFTMFVKLIRKCRDAERRAAVAAFLKVDHEDAGFLDNLGQCAAFERLGCVDIDGRPPTRSPVEMAGVDVQGFVRIAQRFKKERLKSVRKHFGYTGPEQRDLKRMFNKFDKDGNGELKRHELARLVEVLFPSHAHLPAFRPALVKLLKDVDADKSESLDFLEFLCLVRKINNEKDEHQCSVYASAVGQLHFTQREIHEFRSLFLAASEEGTRKLSFTDISSMFSRSFDIDEEKASKLRDLLRQAVMMDNLSSVKDSVGYMEGVADFLAFLRMMRLVIDAGLLAPPDMPASA